MKTPVATFLPLTSLKNFKACLDFITWLKKNQQSGWLMLPINDSIAQPYRNQGIGIASFFYDDQVPQEYRQWIIDKNDFINEHKDWLLDYALYKALSEYFKTEHWWQWPPEIAAYQTEALINWRLKLRSRIEVFIDEQYFLMNQMKILKRKADEHEIVLIGDLPFYVAQASSLVWSHQDLFVLSQDGQLKFQSGVPASKDEPFGEQFWGHPLYNWEEAGVKKVISIFTLRLKFLSAIYDLVRIDHANGFFRYGIMSPENPQWNKKVDGPGAQAMDYLLKQAQKINLGIFLEDIASDSMKLEHYIKENQLVGMKVATLKYNLDNYDSKKLENISDSQLKLQNMGGNNVIFSSTHDTTPLITWVKALPESVKQRIIALNQFDSGITDRGFALALREKILTQKAKLIIIPWQDWQLDDFRFNVPGKEELTNWHYQVEIEKYL